MIQKRIVLVLTALLMMSLASLAFAYEYVNEYQHAFTSDGETFYEYHYGNCDKPTFCEGCNAENAIIGDDNLSHVDINWEHVEYDSVNHWYTCSACGKKVDMGSHYSELEKDADHHWLYCFICDQIFFSEPHHALCTDPARCYSCKATGINPDTALVDHEYTSGYKTSADAHWLECSRCDRVTNQEPHKFVNDVCLFCETAAAAPQPELILPNDLEVIEAEAFAGTDVGYVEIPEGCSAIGERAFADCPALTVISIPSSVTSIADNAFENSPEVLILVSDYNDVFDWADAQGIPCICL